MGTGPIGVQKEWIGLWSLNPFLRFGFGVFRWETLEQTPAGCIQLERWEWGMQAGHGLGGRGAASMINLFLTKTAKKHKGVM